MTGRIPPTSPAAHHPPEARTTRHLPSLAAPPAPHPRVLDIGCGPGRSSLVPAQAGTEVTAVDLHRPYLDELARTAADRGLVVHAVRAWSTDPSSATARTPSTPAMSCNLRTRRRTRS
ncbi:class I SAM-dependent methyltransferase [Nonomuraea coxensis]|uniref:class I SAM-dependent methyltransferase n=1 Tax=Nonomuraea coxensis TaxID=404386 RepID=UPI00146DE136|nr:class I SAM-dependent methyltransferase [Nonomuraea coxensis]